MAGITPYTDESWKRTNEDKVRQMSFKELTQFLAEHFDCECCPAKVGDDCEYCLQAVADWLRKEVE